MTSNKILIVGPAWVGDMVMAQALFKLLKESNPQVSIDVLAPNWSKPLLERMPEVNQALELPFKHGEFLLKQRWQIGKQLRAAKYDQAIVLPNSWKSALIPFFAHIPLRTGWLGEMRYGLLNDARTLDKQKLPLMVERFLALGLNKNENIHNQQNYYPKLAITENSVIQTLTKFNLAKPSNPVIALCPGAEFGPAKRWPSEHYAEVAKQKLAEGCQVWIFGSAKDQTVATEIQQLSNNACVDFTGKTTLGEAIDLMSLASLVITNDSGLMHVAAALQRPIIALYGSSSPRFTPPLSDQVKILSLNLSCSPCFQRECPLGHLKCLRDLLPAEVLRAA